MNYSRELLEYSKNVPQAQDNNKGIYAFYW